MDQDPWGGFGPKEGPRKTDYRGDGDAGGDASPPDSARSSVDSAAEFVCRANKYEQMMDEMESRYMDRQNGIKEEKDANEDIILMLQNQLADLERQVKEKNAELMSEAAARAEQEAAVVDFGRQVALLQGQLQNATALIESGSDAAALLAAQNGRLQAEHVAEGLRNALGAARAEEANLRSQLVMQYSKQVQELKQGIQVLNQRCEQLSADKEDLISENKKNLLKCKEESENRFGEQLRNINQQWKLSQERAETEHKKLLAKLESELETLRISLEEAPSLNKQIHNLLEDKQSLENVVHSLRNQLQQNHLDKVQLDAMSNEKGEELKEALSKSTQEAAVLRSKQAILREENAKLYNKVESLEGAEEALGRLQTRAKALATECERLHDEKQDAEAEAELLYSRWRAAEQEAMRFKRLYTRNSNLRDVIPEEVEEEESSAKFEVENEVDAAERGIGRLRVRPEEMPTGQTAVLGWVEQCEALALRLRTAEANASRLSTQLEHEQARTKTLADEKISLTQRNKQLVEQVAGLQRVTASVARSKLLINQYELKIGQLENEKGHLQEALVQLEDQLSKASSRHIDNKDLEAAAKQAVVLQHSLKHAKHSQILLRSKISDLEELVATLEAGLLAIGTKLEESCAEVSAAWAAANDQQAQAASFSTQLAACQERAARLEQRLVSAAATDELACALGHGLRDLVEQLATEVADLKAALRAERQKTSHRPLLLNNRIEAAVLLEKLGQQREELQAAKSENTNGWAVRLEEQLNEMIHELESREPVANSQHSLDSSVEEEQKRLEVKVRDLQAQLTHSQQQFEGSEREKVALEAEVQALEAAIDQKEQLLREQKKLLELEVVQKELLLKQCRAEATAKEIELLLCRCGSSDIMEGPLDGCGHLEEVKAALDEVHAAAVARLKEQLSFDEASSLKQIQMKHLEQLEEMHKRIESREIKLRDGFADKILKEMRAVLKNLEGDFDERCLSQVLEKVQEGLRLEIEKISISYDQQLQSLKETHAQLLETLKADNVEKATVEMSHSEKESEQKLEVLLKEDKQRRNESLLQQLEQSVCSKLSACVQEICDKWSEKCTKAALEGGEEVAAVVQSAAATINSKYKQEAANLRLALKDTNMQINKQIKDQWESTCEVEELKQIKALLADLKTSGLAVSGLLELKIAMEKKHEKEMEELRTYYEKRWADLNEKYAEDVYSQRSQSRKLSGSSDEFEDDQTKDCDSFSEPPSIKPDERVIDAIEAEWSERLARQEEKHASNIQQLARDLNDAHELEMSRLEEKLRSEVTQRSNAFDLTASPQIKMEEHPDTNISEELRAQFDKELERRVREETQKLSMEIDELVESIKRQNLQEMSTLEEKHKKIVAEIVEQREHLIEELQGKFEKQTAKLKEKHEKEMEELEEELEKRHHASLEMALSELNDQFRQKLEHLEKVLAQAHEKEVLKLQQTIEQQEESFVALLEEQAKRGADSELRFERRLQEERMDAVATLGRHLQAMLAGEHEASEWPPELEQLREHLVAEATGQVAKLKEQHAKEMDALRQQMIQGVEAPLRDQFLQQKQVLGRENEMLRHVVSELVRYLGQLDEQLASFVDTHALGSDTESNASEEERRLRIAPDLSALSEALSLSELDAEQMRADLDACLLRLRREVADIIGVSEASLVGTRQLEDLKQLLAASEAKVAALEARLENRTREAVTEGFGDEGAPLGLELRLVRLVDLQERARGVLQDEPHPCANVLEELVAEAHRLADEARREKDDLHMQIECADKQVRANRAFLDEQAAEREQERDEFARQVQHLRDALKDRERDKNEASRLSKEVECLEGQVREHAGQLQKAHAAAAEAAAQYKAANDKVQVLRDVVKNLESQLEDKQKSEKELKSRLGRLQAAFDQESLIHNEQLDALKNDHSSVDLLDQICLLEEQLSSYKQQLEEKANQEAPALYEMNLQLKTLEMTLDKRTKELERAHKAASSPRESGEGVTSPESVERSPLASIRRLQDKLQNHTRAEDAAFSHIRRLENELKTVQRSEEELQVERCMLQKRVEEQLQQISSLQSRLDQQRFHQSSVEERQNSSLRHIQQRSAEQLEALKEKLSTKESEIKELREQLEKTKRVLAEHEAEAARKEQEATEETERLRERLDLVEEEAIRRLSSSPRRISNQLYQSLIAEKNTEIEELSLQVQVMRERLESVHHTLETSDVTKEQLLEMMQHVEMRTHSTLLRSSSRNSEVLRSSSRAVEFDFGNSTLMEPKLKPVIGNLELDEEPSKLVELSKPATPKVVLEDKVDSLKEQLQQKEILLQQTESNLNQLIEKGKSELKLLQDENNQLKEELATISTRFEEYARQMQTELSVNAQLDASTDSASLDISTATENLQRLLSRVQDGGVEVLSLSELAVLKKHTAAPVEMKPAATQTARSALTDATLVADLKRQLITAEKEALLKEKSLLEKIADLRRQLEESEQQASKLEAAVATEKQLATEARVAQMERGVESRQNMEKLLELQQKLETAERQVQQAKLELEKELCRANALESALAGKDTDMLLLMAKFEGESARHRVTQRNLAAVSQMLDSKDKEYHETREQLEKAAAKAVSLQQQLETKEKSKTEEDEKADMVEVSQQITQHHLRHLLAQEERDRNVRLHFETQELNELVSALRETEARLLQRADRDQAEHQRHRALLEQQLSEARRGVAAEVAALRHEIARPTSTLESATIEAERRAWAVERVQLLHEAERLKHEAVAAAAALSTERAAWLLERLKMQYENSQDRTGDDTITIDHSKVEYLYGKCQQIESQRKSLRWQKRYLQMVIASFEASLASIRAQLPLAPPLPSPTPLARFKGAALVIVALHRMQFLVRTHMRTFRVGSTVVMRRITEALLLSPEPRFQPRAPALAALPPATSSDETPRSRHFRRLH
ncbi:golgin subfamily B member 1-like isoform X2 [Neocloeon triangulifer]|uniref:golgin subfamily B member 1-like isoform X2 n=1 Tax=Neocloeon triangulifer TaxID=2078957 RepID=UPI00286FACF4|nr:golgin subfamily B member 1-like isoform X2 [Neocloeon triangulifer]